MRDGHFENVIVVGSHPTRLIGNAWVMSEGDADAIRKPEVAAEITMLAPGHVLAVAGFEPLGADCGHCRVGRAVEQDGRRLGRLQA